MKAATQTGFAVKNHAHLRASLPISSARLPWGVWVPRCPFQPLSGALPWARLFPSPIFWETLLALTDVDVCQVLVGFFFLLPKQCNSSLLFLLFSFLAVFHTLSPAQSITVGLVTHLLQQRYFSLSSVPDRLNEDPFWGQPSGSCVFIPKSILWRSLYIRLCPSQPCNGQGKWTPIISAQIAQKLPQKPAPTHPLSLWLQFRNTSDGGHALQQQRGPRWSRFSKVESRHRSILLQP